jgi:hypothetical protein
LADAEKAEAEREKLKAELADEREHSEWLQGECNKAVDAMEAANGKKAKATALVAKYKQALTVYANKENWHEDDSGPTGSPKIVFMLHDASRNDWWPGYEIAQSALTGEPASTLTAAQAKERELRALLEKALELLIDHGDPFRGDDWQTVQDIRVALAPGGGTGGEE